MQTREKRSSPLARAALFVLTLALICGAALLIRRAAGTQTAQDEPVTDETPQQSAALTARSSTKF